MIHRSARWCCAACYCSFRLRYIVHRLYSTIVTMRSNWGGSNNPFPFHLPAVAHSGSMAHRLCYSLTGEKTITGSTTWLPTSVYLCFLIFTGVFDWSLVYSKASFFSFFRNDYIVEFFGADNYVVWLSILGCFIYFHAWIN